MKIEELTEDVEKTNLSEPAQQELDLFTQALKYGSSKPNDSSDDPSSAPDEPRKKTTEEILADLNEHPLFMTELEENDALEAIRALAYEGTPAEVGDNFRERGNECFKDKGWKDAKEFYNKGVEVLLLEIRRRQRGEKPKEGVSDAKEEVGKEIKILESLLVNRAATHLELSMYYSFTLIINRLLIVV